MPQNPEAWLLTTARHSLIDLMRHQQLALASEPTLLLLRDEPKEAISSAAFPDERLKLLFVCTNPGDRSDHARALMLQTVLGMDAMRVAHAFLVSPTTTGQRRVRAKTKMRDGGIQFEVPLLCELPQRLDEVLGAIYAASGIARDDMAGVDSVVGIWPRRWSASPANAQRSGGSGTAGSDAPLRSAAADASGTEWPLYSSFGADSQQWSLSLIEEVEHHLAEASRRGRTGRF